MIDTDRGSGEPPGPAEEDRPNRRPWVFVILAALCWVGPMIIAGFFDPDDMPDEFYLLVLGLAWIFLFFPAGCLLLIAAWRVNRRATPTASLDKPDSQPQRRPKGGCLSSTVPPAVIALIWVTIGAQLPAGRDWRLGIVIAAPSVAAAVVAIRGLLAAQRSGSALTWDLLALGIATLALLWSIAWILGATWS